MTEQSITFHCSWCGKPIEIPDRTFFARQMEELVKCPECSVVRVVRIEWIPTVMVYDLKEPEIVQG